MALRRAQVDILLDKDNPDWVNQAQFACPALELAIKEINVRCRTFVTVKHLAAGRTDRSGVGNNIKCLVIVGKGLDHVETFLNGNDVAHALINSLLKATVDKHLALLSGTPSTILEIDNSLNQALVQQAPGLIALPPEPEPFIELEFVLVFSSVGTDIYAIRPLQDMPSPCDAQINWSETPLIVENPANDPLLHREETRDDLAGPGTLSANSGLPIIGDWTYTNTCILSTNDSPATTTTMVHEINTLARTLTNTWDAENSPGTDVGTLLTFGTVVNPTFMFNEVMVQFAGQPQFPLFRSIGNDIADPANSAVIRKAFVETPTIFRKFDSIIKKLLINNNTGVTIPAGITLGELLVHKNAIEEVF